MLDGQVSHADGAVRSRCFSFFVALLCGFVVELEGVVYECVPVEIVALFHDILGVSALLFGGMSGAQGCG
jgi:hypothetical protein